MNKPTAQELWEEIEVEIQLTDYPPYRVQEFISLVQTYAQTYHEEHTQGTIIDIDGQRYNAVLTPYNQPNQ